MIDREQWISEAQAGVEEEHRRLDQDGPSLERYRHPLAETMLGRKAETDVEAMQNTVANPKT